MIIDLTHTLTSKTPTWGGKSGFNLEIKLDYHECALPAQLRVQQVKMHAGIGTHVDAPAHFVQDGRTVDQLKPEELFHMPLFIVDVSDRADDSYLITLDDIYKAEKEAGEIDKNTFVAFYTGWSKHWENQELYRNGDESGVMHFPSLNSDIADYLLKKGIAGLGIDVLSPDDPTDKTFPIHRKVLGADKYIIENMANLDKAPRSGARCSIVPIKMQGATEAPVRVFCEVV